MVGSPEIRLGFQVMEEHLHLSPSSHDSCGVSLPHYLPLLLLAAPLWASCVHFVLCCSADLYISGNLFHI